MKKSIGNEQGGDLNPAEEEDREEAQGTEEARKVRAPAVPILPSREEVLDHRLTHFPFRSWCPHCVRGKSRDDAHRTSPNKAEEGTPQIVSDYFFVGRKRAATPEERAADDDEAERSGQTPIIVIKDRAS